MATETILVVDDEANIRELARAYLEKNGYRVLVAVNGQQALDTIRQQTPDLVVLDLMFVGAVKGEIERGRGRQPST